MWRGPSWAAPNYFILHALYYQGSEAELALFREFAGRFVGTVRKVGVWEMYGPEDGAGMGVKELGMTTSVVDIAAKLEAVSAKKH
jgi:hypothetical protein